MTEEEAKENDPKAPGFLIFTSGSTGKPKAVMLSGFNLVSNLLDSRPLGDYRGGRHCPGHPAAGSRV